MLEKKEQILTEVLGDYSRSGNELLFYCSECGFHKKKLSVNLSKNCWKCWFCDFRGKNIYFLIRKYGNFTQKARWRSVAGIIDQSEIDLNFFEEVVEDSKPIDLPEEFKTLTKKEHTPPDYPAVSYLVNRGITKEDMIWWKMGYCGEGQYTGRIIIPSFDLRGDINFFIARNYINKWKSYLNPPAPHNFIFNELYLDWSEPVTIVEGVFDAIKTGNAIPLLGSTLREDSYVLKRLVEETDRVYLGLDPDASIARGDKSKEQKIVEILRKYGLEVHKLPIDGYKDLGEMKKEQVTELKRNAVTITEDYYFEKMLENV